MKFVLVIAAMIMLVACGRKPDAETAAVMPGILAPGPAYKPMTNDEIIAENTKCINALMDAEGLKVAAYGDTYVMIQCVPRKSK